MSGVLRGIRIVELASLGPGPFAAMMLADHGAEVIRIERPNVPAIFDPELDMTRRNRTRVLTLDLKSAEGRDAVRALCRQADGLIEGFRPGVMERLGLGPDLLGLDNPRLVYGRMTGWGQTGPMAGRAGHDINYIALSGALATYGQAGGPPVPPVNAVGDFGGGGMMLAFGIVAALLAAQRDGRGRVIDCSMTEGAALLQASVWTLRAMGGWVDRRGENLLDGGAPFYAVYATSDGRYMAVGAIEPPFYRALLEGLGLEDDPAMADPSVRARWPSMGARIAAVFLSRSQADWTDVFADTDACVTPVLAPAEAPNHPQARARCAFGSVAGHPLPEPAPRIHEPRVVPAAAQSEPGQGGPSADPAARGGR